MEQTEPVCFFVDSDDDLCFCSARPVHETQDAPQIVFIRILMDDAFNLFLSSSACFLLAFCGLDSTPSIL